jgi:molybdenum cofactor cytidylyltransferase
MRFGVAILAAGVSSRMGRPKLLLPWGEKTILAHLIQQWTALGSSQIGVVIEPKSALIPHLANVDQIANPEPHRGMFSSVQCAAMWESWKKEITHFVITLGDQPQVESGTLKVIMNFVTANPEHICQLSRNGRPRHPVVLPRKYFLELGTAKESNLKEFLRARESQRRLLESADDALDVDIDTPEDYQRALNKRHGDSDVLSS